jgi:hypothetical protein
MTLGGRLRGRWVVLVMFAGCVLNFEDFYGVCKHGVLTFRCLRLCDSHDVWR